MYIIGEKINGMFKKVNQAIKERNEEYIKQLAQQQIESGADALDVNVGYDSIKILDDMIWLVKTIRKVTSAPISIDTTKPDVMEETLKVAGENSFINSSHGDNESLDLYLPMAKKYNSNLIVLTITKSGIPQDTSGKMWIVSNIISKCLEHEFDLTRLYIDPVLLPLNVSQQNALSVLEVIQQIKTISDPPPKTTLGLSNISQGTKYRNLINKTFAILAIQSGLDSAIIDPLDSELINSIITAEICLNKQLYCDSFLEAYKKQK